MTGRERVLQVLGGGPADHRAFMPITMMFAADVIGVPYKRYATDYRALAEGQLRTAEVFGIDHVSAISDPAREAADRGAHVLWYDDQPPAIIEDDPLLLDKGVLKTLHNGSGERMEDRLRGIELLRQGAGDSLLVEGWVEGPCAEAADLRGLCNLMLDFYDDTEFVHELFDFTCEGAIAFAHQQIRAGADLIGIGDAAASLVGPDIYREFVWPYEKRLVDAVHHCGGLVRLHICGNTRPMLKGMAELGCDMVDLDYPVPMDDARQEMGPEQVLAGNLDPVRAVRNGNPGSILSALERLKVQAGEHWIVAAGCEIPRDTPHENLRAMAEFAARVHVPV